MGHRGHGKGRDTRLLIANEAARLMASDGGLDFHSAKRKAAQHLGFNDSRGLPSNQEVEDALLVYQRIFHQDTQPETLKAQRQAALEAMQLLAGFEPRLVGAVLSGTAAANSDIQLHLFASTPEEVAIFLLNHKIPYREFTTQLRSQGERQDFPGLGFMAGEHGIELIIFPNGGLKHPPLSPVDGKPMRRASAEQVEVLLNEA